MLNRRGYDAAARPRSPNRSFYREIVGFGAAAGENDLARTGADEIGDTSAAFLEQLARALAGPMHGRRVPVTASGKLNNRGDRLGSQRRTRVMIEKNTHS